MRYDEDHYTLPPSPGRTKPDMEDATIPKAKGGKNKKIANGIVALGSAAIISVYGLGYVRTQSAEASLGANNPTIAIATIAPTTASAAASSQTTTFPSPLLAPSATAVTPSATATGASSSAATGSVGSTATTAPVATTAPATATVAPTTAAKAPATATTAAAKTAAYTDGTYTGTGTSRHGSITASVVIQGGKIVSADITQCGTRYPCSQIAALPGQVVSKQSATVNLVSGATDSSQAYIGAIRNALAKAAA